MAGGEVGGLDALTARVAELEQTLRDHATVIQTAPECAPSWTGEAAQAYAGLSFLVAAHFERAAGTAADAEHALARWSTELDRCQREGMLALTEAEHWLAEIKDRQQALAGAQGQLTGAQRALDGAHAAIASAHGPTIHLYQAAAATAQQSLTTAQQATQTAQTNLAQAHEQLALWQRRGRQAWQEAETAAQTASGTLAPLFIAPPPLAGLPALLSTIPPFAAPAEEACRDPAGTTTPNANTDGIPGKLRDLAAGIATISPAAAAVLAALAKALEEGAADEGIGRILADPESLAGKTPGDLLSEFGGMPSRWEEGTLGRGSRAGEGWTLRERGENGDPTGRVIRYHPGGGHHGPDPYWRVSSPESGKSGIIPAGPRP